MWFTGNNIPGLVGRITLPPLVREMAADRSHHVGAPARQGARELAGDRVPLRVGGARPRYGNETPDAYAGSSYDLNVVMATVNGLEPGTKYHYRLVAENDAGETEGADSTFTTEAIPAEPAEPADRRPADPVDPSSARRVVAEPEGTVRVKAPGGGWETMDPVAEMPSGPTFDTRRGAVNITTAGCRGNTQTGRFGGGLFTLRQPRPACGRVDVYLRGGTFSGCPRPGARGTRAAAPWPRPRGPSACASSGAAIGAEASARTGATARRRCAAPAGSRWTAATARSPA